MTQAIIKSMDWPHKAARSRGGGEMTDPGGADQSAAQAAAALYDAHYRSLLALAAGLVRRQATAEQIVQDSFTGLQAAWPRLRDEDGRLSYLRQCVVNRSHSVLRHCRDEARS
jgi:DNA-directed RNA polymerase specialized sigma24 family protein